MIAVAFSTGICVRRTAGDLPDGLVDGFPVQPRLQKYFHSRFTQITLTPAPFRCPQEGRFAIVTNVGRGMRWT